jgi:hypothetical protein
MFLGRNGLPRTGGIRDRPFVTHPVIYPCTKTSGVAPVATTWALDACAASRGIAEPARADPAVLSARIAGTMMARFTRMIPPGGL